MTKWTEAKEELEHQIPTVKAILNCAPPFDEPAQPLSTREEMARWLVWQRFNAGSGRSPGQFFAALMIETKAELLWRCRRWPQFAASVLAAAGGKGEVTMLIAIYDQGVLDPFETWDNTRRIDINLLSGQKFTIRERDGKLYITADDTLAVFPHAANAVSLEEGKCA